MKSQGNIRSRIAAGEELVALRADIGWSKDQLASAFAGGEYDFIWLDSQHSPYSDDHLVSFTAATEQLGIPVQLRISHTRDAHKVGFFDLGDTGALVPEVMEQSTVQDAIDFAYYGPIGRRSWGGANRLGLRNRVAPTSRREYGLRRSRDVARPVAPRRRHSASRTSRSRSVARRAVTHTPVRTLQPRFCSPTRVAVDGSLRSLRHVEWWK